MAWVVLVSSLRLREARDNADPELVITLIGNKADKARIVDDGVFLVRIVGDVGFCGISEVRCQEDLGKILGFVKGCGQHGTACKGIYWVCRFRQTLKGYPYEEGPFHFFTPDTLLEEG